MGCAKLFSVYASIPFLKSYSGVIQTGYIVEEDMFLPFVVTKAYFRKTMHFPVEIQGNTDLAKQKTFLDKLPQFIKSNFKVTSATTDNTAVFQDYPKNSMHCRFGSYIVDLTKDESELFSSLHSKHRNVIRKAQKDGIIINHGREFRSIAINLMNETFTRQGLSGTKGDNYLRRLDEMGENVEYWIAEDVQHNVHGSAIFVWSKGNSCYYLHGGSSEHTPPGAMNLLIWEAMLSMKERGVSLFDFVGARVSTESGSKLEGIQRFKERFGSTLKEGYAFEIIVNKVEYNCARFLTRVNCRIHGIKYKPTIIEQEIQRGNI